MIRFLLMLFIASILAVPCVDSAEQSSVSELDVTAEMVKAANALLGTVEGDETVIEEIMESAKAINLQHPFDGEPRGDWSYLPGPRDGMSIGHMTAQQRSLTHDLLASVLSSRGHLKVSQIMQLEEVLRGLDTRGAGRTIENYTVAVFGRPSLKEPWAWRFEGHHVSVNVTVLPEGMSVTPSFLGSNPAQIQSGPMAGVKVLRLEEDLARKLVQSMNKRQLSETVLKGNATGDILTGPAFKSADERTAWRDAFQPDGISVASLSAKQQQLVGRLVEEVVTGYRAEVADAVLDELDIKTLHFAWIGSMEPGKPHYYRLQGKDFVFEYDNSQNNANHIHTVWRDRAGDFGENILKRHYDQDHR